MQKEKKEKKDYKIIIFIIITILLLLLLFSCTIGIGKSENKELDLIQKIESPIEEEYEEQEEQEKEEEKHDIPENKDPVIKEEVEKPVILPVIPSNILVEEEEVILLHGDNFDLFKGVTIDTGRELLIESNIKDTTLLEPGTHQVMYTAKDIDGRTITKQRKLVILNPLSDEDNDGYTNEEEIKNNINPMDENTIPEYAATPSLDVSTCKTNMTVYSSLPDFSSCIVAEDKYYNKENLAINIKNDINNNKIGIYKVLVEVSDVLNNKISKEIEFKVNKKEITIKIDNKQGVYLENIKELTSNASDSTLENTDIGVNLSTTATNTSTVGTYPITGTWTNENYDVTFINGTYTINKAVPTFVIPTGLSANEGSTLSQIVLPEGFTYQDETTNKLEPGTYEVKLTYTPKDTTNYIVVKDINAKVKILLIPSNILIAQEEVVLLEGDEFDLFKDVTIDTGKNIDIKSNISDTKTLSAGEYQVIYSATDLDGRNITNQRKLIILSKLKDEDKDGYTNEEEMKNGNNPLNIVDTPTYDKNPYVNISTCPTSITVYSELPDLTSCVTAKDNYYNISNLTIKVDTSNVDNKNIGTYKVIVEVTDVLNNKTTKEYDFVVNKKEVIIKIDNKESLYASAIEQLTSNEKEVTLKDTEIGVNLSTTATNTSTVGTYPITGTWTNENYDVTFINGTYTINKAVPTFAIPTGLTAEEDETLDSIELPEGFTYQGETNEALKPGTYEVKLTYTPSDTTNYEIVKDITVDVVITPAVYYTITFVDKDNNVLSTQSIRKGKSAEEPDVLEEYEANNKDYVFSGWVGNYIEVDGDATIRPLYIEESTSTTYAYVLDPKYNMPEDGYGYPTNYYTNALEAEDGSKIPLSIKIGGLTEQQAQSIQNQQTTIVALNDADIFKYLTGSTREQLNNISVGTDNIGSYRIEWYVLKYQPDGWHLDGYKVYDELTLEVSQEETTYLIRNEHLSFTFVNAVENVEVEIDGVEKSVVNSSGNDDIGNQYAVTHTAQDEEQTITIRYTFKGIEYTKEYTITGEAITPKESLLFKETEL